MLQIGIAVFMIISLILFFSNSNLKEKNKQLTKSKNSAENSASIYFNTLILYRDVIIRNNLSVPGEIPTMPDDSNDNYNIDDILDEISEKGIDNVSVSKLNFLKNNQNGKK